MKKSEKIVALKKAREYVEKGWIQKAIARNQSGERVDYIDEEATCFCLEGAIRRACKLLYITDYGFFSIAGDFREELGNFYSIHRWNDYPERTKEEVLYTVDKVIKALEKEQNNE